jgi:hypothetical protein
MKAALLALLLITGCTSLSEPDPVAAPATPENADPRLKANMKFKADGVQYQGAVLLSRRSSTKFSVDIPKETRKLFVDSCTRDEDYDNPVTPFEYTFIPGMWKENIGSCALFFTAITKTGEYHRAVIDFTNSVGRDMPADMFCGSTWTTLKDGAGICQVRAGKPASVRFQNPVIYSYRPECAAPKCVAGCAVINDVQLGLEFDIEVTAGLCGYDFNNKANEMFRLSTVGYVSVLNIFPPLNGNKTPER